MLTLVTPDDFLKAETTRVEAGEDVQIFPGEKLLPSVVVTLNVSPGDKLETDLFKKGVSSPSGEKVASIDWQDSSAPFTAVHTFKELNGQNDVSIPSMYDAVSPHGEKPVSLYKKLLDNDEATTPVEHVVAIPINPDYTGKRTVNIFPKVSRLRLSGDAMLDSHTLPRDVISEEPCGTFSVTVEGGEVTEVEQLPTEDVEYSLLK